MENNDANLATIKIDELRHRTEDYVRDEPLKSVGIAVGAGVLLTVFPIFSLLFAIVRLALGLLKPVLLVLGGMKLYEEVSRKYSV